MYTTLKEVVETGLGRETSTLPCECQCPGMLVGGQCRERIKNRAVVEFVITSVNERDGDVHIPRQDFRGMAKIWTCEICHMDVLGSWRGYWMMVCPVKLALSLSMRPS